MNMTQPVLSSRKRPLPDNGSNSGDFSTREGASTKRQRTLSLEDLSRPNLRLSIPSVGYPPTPPSSVVGAATMALKLIIPQEQITREQQRTLKRHRADAERWKPKLQRPFPNRTETKNAYPLKLMRHYPGLPNQAQPNFVRPKLDKSPRLTSLLQQFPLIDTTQHAGHSPPKDTSSPITPAGRAIPLSTRGNDLEQARLVHFQLFMNMQATGTEYAQQLAWQSFSVPEYDRLDRGREAMILSGLASEDLTWESLGFPNTLPEWRKPRTGRFVARQQEAT